MQALAAVGLIDQNPEVPPETSAKLVEVRRESLQKGVRGPLRSIHLRYRDVWHGKRRKFLWSAESYLNPDGTIAYAIVVAEEKQGRLNFLVSGGASSLRGDYSGEEGREYQVVYEGLNRYILDHRLEDQLKP